MKYLAVFSVLVLVAVILCGFIPSAEDARIYDDVVRLHVIANSDSPEDQGTKLIVRNEVLSYIDSLVKKASDARDAANIIEDDIDSIRAAVCDTIEKLCADLSCDVTLSYEYYPTRQYDDLSLPAGRYRSLRIKLGEAAGQNWWCVLYPSICTSGAKAKNVLRQTGFSPDQINILTGDEKPVYKIKFKFLEFFSGMSS